MRVLLDSDVVVNWVGFPHLLKANTIALLTNPETEVFISPVSIWELGPKVI
ncbi:MAG: hypothetical protein HOH58_01825 [Opitutaceae bacterium]|jgi:PIN domain nuclease of toxin-antitoxin system|nr:hypothetical protein [Opitutaceae bacterium]